MLFDSFFDTIFHQNPVLEALGVVLMCSWTILGRSWAVLELLDVVLGLSWAVLGRSWAVLEPLGAPLGHSWAVLGHSWSLLDRSKIDQKVDPKIDPKSSRIRDGQNRSGATPVDVSELDKPQRTSDETRLESYRNL